MPSKAAPTKSTTDHIETTSVDNVISVAQWAETTAIVKDGMFKCAMDMTEISRVATQAMVVGYADYGNEVRGIGSACTTFLISNLTKVGHQLMDEGTNSVKVENGFSDMMQQVQRLMAANSLLAERQVKAVADVCQALAAVPTCILGLIAGK